MDTPPSSAQPSTPPSSPATPSSATPPVAPITPAPTTPAPVVPPKGLKATLKRLGIVAVAVYVVTLFGIFGWAFLVGQNSVSIFTYLPISQTAWGNFLMGLFNVMLGSLVGVTFLGSIFGFLKSLLTKKEDIEKKKQASKLALWGGISFFILTVAWLFGIYLLGPQLVKDDLYSSPIKTTPESPLNLTSPVEVSFDGSGIPLDSSYKVISYTWDFGDGNSGNGMSTAHTYTHKADGDGLYTVTLTVKYMDLKSGQQFDDEYKTQVGIANEEAAASFTATPSSGEIPLKVHFDATGSYDPNGEITAYEWDMNNDGKYDDATGMETDYDFTLEGTYTVSLRVTDNNGDYSTTSQTIEAGSVGGLHAVITTSAGANGNYYVGTQYSFDGKLSQIGTGKITKYTWNYGDGTKTDQSLSVKHTFSKAGTYEVTLSVSDQDGNLDEATLEVTVIEEGNLPVAVITTTPAATAGTITGAVPLAIKFSGTSSTDEDDDIVQYDWDFDSDDSIDDSGDTVSYTYPEVGTYTATLTVTDSVGNQDTATVGVTVTVQGIVADLQIDQTNGEVPLTVHFDASGSTYKEGSIVSYEYDFGDGTAPYITGSSVTYKYNSVGNYTASVTVVGSDGKKATDTVEIVVRPVALTACFTVNTASGTAPLFVAVDASCSTGTVSTYAWDFGDGVLSYDHKPEVHSYTKAGTYIIKLEVTSPEGIVSDFQNTITVK